MKIGTSNTTKTTILRGGDFSRDSILSGVSAWCGGFGGDEELYKKYCEKINELLPAEFTHYPNTSEIIAPLGSKIEAAEMLEIMDHAWELVTA